VHNPGGKMSVRKKIYQTIRDEIMYGQLLPGERLIEKDLSEKFSASRNTIRESLRQLQIEGLLTFKPNKGFQISKLSIEQVDEVYTLRMILESYATKITAEKATSKHVACLEKFQKGCIKAAAEHNLEAWIKHNTDFHHFFYENCGNSNLKMLLEILKRRVYRYQYIIIRTPGLFKNFLKSHEKIIQACRDNDGLSAEKHMRMHTGKNKEVLLDQLSKISGIHPVL
jgi:DNA-binding GntR family transcriptional regulator